MRKFYRLQFVLIILSLPKAIVIITWIEVAQFKEWSVLLSHENKGKWRIPIKEEIGEC